MNNLNELLSKIRLRLSEYRFHKIGETTSIDINAIEISICLTEYALEIKRPINKSEESWFDALWQITQVLENSDWEDLIDLYIELGNEVEKINFFRGNNQK